MISEQSLDGWDNKPVKFSNVKYPQTKDNNAPQNFFLAIFCGSRGSGKTYLLTKLLKLLEEKKIYLNSIILDIENIKQHMTTLKVYIWPEYKRH